MINIVVFASGSGSNFQAVINAVDSGLIAANISGLITNKAGIRAIKRAKNYTISHQLIDPKKFESESDFESALLVQLEDWRADLIILAGYMIKIPNSIVNKYEGRIINIHPSLLPKYGGKGFYGIKVHETVLENGEQESGCSVHLVTEEYDDGPVLGRRKVKVKESDTAETLANRILEQEHQLLPEVVAHLAQKLTSKSYT